MNKYAIRLLTLAMFTMALIAVPLLTPAHASGDESPSPPASSGTKKEKAKSSSLEDGRFVAAYHAAYTTVYDRNDYAAAIEQLKALGHDDNASVAT